MHVLFKGLWNVAPLLNELAAAIDFSSIVEDLEFLLYFFLLV